MQRYYYKKASGIRRIAVRFLDQLIISIVVIFFDFLIHIGHLHNWVHYLRNDRNIKHTDTSSSLSVFPLAAAAIISIFYFLFVAYCCNCQTIGKKIASIRVVDQQTLKKPSFKKFIAHEFLISVLPAICTFMFFIYFLFVPLDQINISSNGITVFKNTSVAKRIALITIATLYGFINTIILFIIIFLLLSKKKTAFHDLISTTWTINTTKFPIADKKSNEEHINSNPLEIFYRNK